MQVYIWTPLSPMNSEPPLFIWDGRGRRLPHIRVTGATERRARLHMAADAIAYVIALVRRPINADAIAAKAHA